MILFLIITGGLLLFAIVLFLLCIPADVGRQMEYALEDIFDENKEDVKQ